ncbi:separin isoform X2, partial [Paramuricea clavata]
MTNALDSFTTSLTYLHPCYNPVLLTQICHALVLCYGLKSPEKAAVYQNMVMATTLRHQTLNRSSKKIRKGKDKQIKDGKDDEDELLKLLDSTRLDKDERKGVNQMLHLQTIKNTVGFRTSAGDISESFKNTIELLPEDLTVCTLSIVQAPDRENMKHLVITRLRKNNESLFLIITLPNEEEEADCMEQEFQTNDSVVRDLSSIFRRSILSDFAAIMRELNESIKIKSKREWWSRREQVDNQLERFVQRMEETWFGRWRGILSGRRLDETDCSRLHSYVERTQEMAVEILGRRIQNEQLLEVLTDSFCHLQPNEVMKALTELTGMRANCKQLIKFSKALSNFLDDNESVDNAIGVKRGPVVLILDKSIQHLPFEAMPILRDQQVSRMPSLEFINAYLSLQKITKSRVDTRQTFYVLNPQDNLPNTEKKFSDWFLSEKGWKGVVGRAPSAEEFKEALANHQLFIYMGHGNGREFLKGDEITRLYCQAVALIMGCSSGKLI